MAHLARAVWLAAALCIAACAAPPAPTPKSAAPRADVAAHCREAIGDPRIEELATGVWIAVGFDLMNTTLIDTPRGSVVVDPGFSMPRAARIRAAFGTRVREPILAIIYTHSHIDHVNAASVWAEPGTEIWATDAFRDHFIKQYGVFQPAESVRGARQFGRGLTAEASPCSALGLSVDFAELDQNGIRWPTRTFSNSVAVDFGGRRLELIEAHGETDDQLMVWIPDAETLLPGDNYYAAFPNLYTIRGSRPRPVGEWIASLDRMRRLNPAVLGPSHTVPVRGRDEIRARLTDYRDAIAYVRDEVIRRANRGESADAIAAAVRLPPHLASKPWLQGLYGQVDWSARAIYTNELGWFDGRVDTLYPLPPTEFARHEIDQMGGSAAVLAAGQRALQAGDPRWALHLAEQLRLLREPAADPGAADRLAVAALRAIAATVDNTNGRSYLLVSALEIEGRAAAPLHAVPNDALLRELPVRMFLEIMAARLRPDTALDVHETVCFRFVDRAESYWLTVRRGVAELAVGEPLPATPEPIATVTTDTLTWKRLALQRESALVALASGRLKISGSKARFLQFIDRFDRDI